LLQCFYILFSFWLSPTMWIVELQRYICWWLAPKFPITKAYIWIYYYITNYYNNNNYFTILWNICSWEPCVYFLVILNLTNIYIHVTKKFSTTPPPFMSK
jgi:hypothetical protein